MDTTQETQPPGTTRLLEFTASRDSSQIVLVPKPSNDPNDPLNWSNPRKIINFLFISSMAMMAFTLVTFQAIFWQQMVVDLNTTFDKLSNGNSLQLAGLASGCFLVIPFAVKYGRRLVYLFSVALMAGGSWWTSRITSYEEMLAANFVTGFAGAINETTVQMTIADLLFVHQRATANAVYFLAAMIGSYVTPIAAGAIAASEGWRWAYYALSISLTILLLLFIVGFEETKYSRPALVMDSGGPRNEELPKDVDEEHHDDDQEKVSQIYSEALRDQGTDAPKLNTYWDRMRLVTPTDESLFAILIAPFRVIFLPHILFTALQFSFVVAWLVLTVVMKSIFFSSPPYSFNTAGVGYMNIGPFVGSLVGSLYGGPFSDWSVKYFARRNGGLYEPEMRLYIMIVPALCISGGIIMYGVTASMGLHWILPSIGGAIFALGLAAVGDITFTFVIDSYQEVVAEAFVGISFLRNIGGIVLPVLRPIGVKAMGVKNQFILVGCLSFAILMLHVPMIIWGKAIRRRTAGAYYRAVRKLEVKRE